MAYTGVNLPLTGAGDATAAPAVDLVGGLAFQAVKLFDGTEGSTAPIVAKGTTPGAADSGMVVRPIGSTAFNQAVVGAVGLTSGSSAVELTSAGSTRLVGQVTVANPTTGVSLSSQHTVTADLSSVGSTRAVGMVGITSGSSAVGITSGSSAVELTSAGSTRLAGRFDVNNQPTVDLSSVGSTRVVGLVGLSSQITVSATGTTAVDLSSGGSTKVIGTVNATGTTKVDVSSGVILGAGSSANMLGQVFATGTTKVDVSSGVILAGGSSANTLGSVALVAGTSANIVGTVALTGGTTANSIGSVALVAGTSGNVVGSVTLSPGASTVGSVQQGAGSSANFWFTQSIPFSSANTARSSVNTSVDVSVIAANAARKGLIIANLSTAQIVGLGLSTGAVTTALANINVYLSPNSQLTFGMGQMPLFTGPIRGINISSTAIAGGVGVVEFT